MKLLTATTIPHLVPPFIENQLGTPFPSHYACGAEIDFFGICHNKSAFLGYGNHRDEAEPLNACDACRQLGGYYWRSNA